MADNSRLAIPFSSTRLFSGQAVDSTAVLVKFTHRVDLDLDGVITTNDATIFNSNYSEGGAARWGIGDVDFDGLFTTNDATLFNSYYDESLGAVEIRAGRFRRPGARDVFARSQDRRSGTPPPFRSRGFRCACACEALESRVLLAAAPTLVRDINTTSDVLGPADITPVGSYAFFTGHAGPAEGTELMRTDGTKAGTDLVKDIVPGIASSQPANLTNANGTAVLRRHRRQRRPGALEERRHGRGHRAGEDIRAAGSSNPSASAPSAAPSTSPRTTAPAPSSGRATAPTPAPSSSPATRARPR